MIQSPVHARPRPPDPRGAAPDGDARGLGRAGGRRRRPRCSASSPTATSCSRPTARARSREVMTGDELVTAPAGTTLEDAEAIMARHKIEKLPIVDAERRLRGLITVKDILKRRRFPRASKDERGRLIARGRDRDRAGDDGPRARAGRRPASTCWSSTPRTATPRACSQTVRAGPRSAFPTRASSPATSRPRKGRARWSSAEWTRSRSESDPARSARRASSRGSACRSSRRSWTARRSAARPTSR